MDWFLNDRNLRYERVQVSFCHSLSSSNLPLNFTYYSPAKMLVKGKEDLNLHIICFALFLKCSFHLKQCCVSSRTWHTVNLSSLFDWRICWTFISLFRLIYFRVENILSRFIILSPSPYCHHSCLSQSLFYSVPVAKLMRRTCQRNVTKGRIKHQPETSVLTWNFVPITCSFPPVKLI